MPRIELDNQPVNSAQFEPLCNAILEHVPSKPLEEETLCRLIAYICGPHSAAADAIRHLEQLRAAGHESGVLRFGTLWIVREPPIA